MRQNKTKIGSDPTRSFWCLACPTRIHIETTKKLGGSGSQFGCNFDRCPACGEAMWSVQSLIEGHYTGYIGVDFVLPKGALGTDAREHDRLNKFRTEQHILSEEDDAKRAIDQANKKLAAIAEKRKAR